MPKTKSHKPFHQRLEAIVIALECLASGIEVLREGTGRLILTLPEGCEAHRLVLHEQFAALERISIALGMIQGRVEELRKDAADSGKTSENPLTGQGYI